MATARSVPPVGIAMVAIDSTSIAQMRTTDKPYKRRVDAKRIADDLRTRYGRLKEEIQDFRAYMGCERLKHGHALGVAITRGAPPSRQLPLVATREGFQRAIDFYREQIHLVGVAERAFEPGTEEYTTCERCFYELWQTKRL